MASRRSRVPSLRAVITIVWCLGIAWSPGAWAGPLDGLPDDSEAVSDTTDATTDGASNAVGTVGQVGDAIDGVTGSDTGAIDGATGSDTGGDVIDGPTDVVDGTGEAADGMSGSVDDAVDGVTGSDTGDAVDDVTDTISDPTGEATDPVTDPIDDALGGGGDTDGAGTPIGGAVDPRPGNDGQDPDRSSGGRNSAGRGSSVEPQWPGAVPGFPEGEGAAPPARRTPTSGSRSGRTQGGGVGRSFEVPLAPIDAFARALSPTAGTIAAALGGDPEGAAPAPLWSRALEGAAELANNVGFPLALALIVGGFLALHNKVDRHDPKLALAPLDQDQEVLYFK